MLSPGSLPSLSLGHGEPRSAVRRGGQAVPVFGPASLRHGGPHNKCVLLLLFFFPVGTHGEPVHELFSFCKSWSACCSSRIGEQAGICG